MCSLSQKSRNRNPSPSSATGYELRVSRCCSTTDKAKPSLMFRKNRRSSKPMMMPVVPRIHIQFSLTTPDSFRPSEVNKNPAYASRIPEPTLYSIAGSAPRNQHNLAVDKADPVDPDHPQSALVQRECCHKNENRQIKNSSLHFLFFPLLGSLFETPPRELDTMGPTGHTPEDRHGINNTQGVHIKAKSINQ